MPVGKRKPKARGIRLDPAAESSTLAKIAAALLQADAADHVQRTQSNDGSAAVDGAGAVYKQELLRRHDDQARREKVENLELENASLRGRNAHAQRVIDSLLADRDHVADRVLRKEQARRARGKKGKTYSPLTRGVYEACGLVRGLHRLSPAERRDRVLDRLESVRLDNDTGFMVDHDNQIVTVEDDQGRPRAFSTVSNLISKYLKTRKR